MEIMVALVEHGAPRDFRDIHTVCMAGLSTPDDCWSLWRQRQALVRLMTSIDWIDSALYPGVDPPNALSNLDDRIDFLARLCAAWDVGLLPEAQTLAEIRKPEWRNAVDECQLLTSPTHHLLRMWHDLPVLPYLGQRLAYIAEDSNLAYI
jgi:hypothetical protein